MTAADRSEAIPRKTAGAFATLVVLLTALLLTLSLSTLDRIKYTVLASGDRSVASVFLAVQPLDWALVAIAAAIAAGLTFPPAMRQHFVEVWRRQSWHMFVLVGALLLWSGHAILDGGLLVTGDAGTHVARVNHLALALMSGQSPFWDNYFFGGSTLLQFTGPLFHWFAAALQLVVGDPTLAIKIVSFAARFVAALFMYLYLRRFGASRAAASIGAVFYGGAFFITYMEVIRSSFPQLINFAAMPAIFYFVERILRDPGIKAAGTVGLALSTIAFIGCHPPTALLFGFYTAIYLLVRSRATGLGWPTIGSLAAALVLVLLGSAFFLVPFAAERAMTADNFGTGSLVTLAWPSLATLRGMAIWGQATTGANYAAYAGLPMLVCAAAGLYPGSARLGRDGVALRSVCVTLLSLALLSLFARGAFVREATFTFFLLCSAAGIGVELLGRRVKSPEKLFAAVFLLTAIDAAPLAIQPWARMDLRAIADAGSYLADRAADSRVVEVWRDGGKPVISVDPTLSPLSYARLQILVGPHKQDATRAHNAFASVLKVAAADLRANRRLEPATQRMLASLNVGWIVGDDVDRMGLPDDFRDTLKDDRLGTYWRIRDHTPFVVSGRLQMMERPAAFDASPFWEWQFDAGSKDAADGMAAVREIDRRMATDGPGHSAATILVPSRPAGAEWAADEPSPPNVRQLSYHVAPDTVRLSVDSDGPGFIRIAHPVGLGTIVSQDGATVAPVPDVESLIVLPLHEGRNDFVVTQKPSALRRICFWLSVATSALLVVAGAILAAGRYRVRPAG